MTPFKVLLWERQNSERCTSAEACFRQYPVGSRILPLIDDTSRDAGALYSTNRLDRREPVLVLIHLSNRRPNTGGVLEVVEQLLAELPSAHLVLYSGGMQGVDLTDPCRPVLRSDGEPWPLNVADPARLCIVPFAVGDDLAADLHLPRALRLLAEERPMSEVFEAILDSRPEVELYLRIARDTFPLEKIRDPERREAIRRRLDELSDRNAATRAPAVRLTEALEAVAAADPADADLAANLAAGLRERLDHLSHYIQVQ